MIDIYGRFWPDYPGQPDPRYFPSPAGTRGQPSMSQPSGMTMTPPTIHAEIIQIENEKEVDDAVVPANSSQMFMTRDEKVIIVKSASANGAEVVTYDRRPPAPEPPKFDPRVYPTRDEVANYIEERLNSLQTAQSAPRSAAKKGAGE